MGERTGEPGGGGGGGIGKKKPNGGTSKKLKRFKVSTQDLKDGGDEKKEKRKPKGRGNPK